jgi:membrane fusion protein
MSRDPDVPFLDTSPPIWAARALTWVLLAMFVVAASGVVLIHVPETVTAPFVLKPKHGVNPVRTLHDGVVTGVQVADAEIVEAGAVLFTIDSESAGDRGTERAALATSLSGGRARLANERNKYKSQRQADERERKRLEQRVTALAARAILKERQLHIAREVASRQQRSHEAGLTSWVEASKPRLEAERFAGELEETRAESAETQAIIARLGFEVASRKAAYDEQARSVEEELEQAGTRKRMLDAEGSRAGNALLVRAPCAGTVVNLVVKNAGSIVRGADVLAEVACRDASLMAELMVPQRGLTMLRAGQPVKLRYDAFPYQRYGVQYGTLHWISPAAAGSVMGASFRALADLDEHTVPIGGKPRTVLPGMGGQASIVVGRRSLASYAVEPLRQMREAMSTGRPPGGD